MEEEINRATLWKKARELQGGFDSNVQVIIDKIDELHNSRCFESCGIHDALTEALGTEEQRGHHYLDTEKKKVDKRFNKLEEELKQLKRCMKNVSEAAICQMGGYEEDFEDESLDDFIKAQCEDDLFGYESYTYLTWDDFLAVFTLEELIGVVIISYMMYLFEQIKNVSKRDHGTCFVIPTASSPRERKAKSKSIDDSCRRLQIGCLKERMMTSS
ncbi:hypothetical protein L1987_06412 [Smallanthus sonchifolius]|uniref:Uncharacterized protein n=1 Tax=Smallanthus sonchifolius TaxID=185202 RepID=A0ACB9JY19_9ASTR|nr:hypothetical protein L1987_06412 [Smallanthus sonchifolius]